MAALLAGTWLLLGALHGEVPEQRHAGERQLFRLGAVGEILSRRLYRDAYLGIFCIFFVFASVLNYVPFRLTELSPGISELAISLVYVGYLSGALIASNGVRISGWVGGELRGTLFGLVLLVVGVSGLLFSSLATSYLFVFLMCAGFFLVHSLLSAFVNHRATESKGLVNGLYIAFYYSGGALGSWLPGFLYRASGWDVYIATLLVFLGMTVWWIWRMRYADV